MANIIKIKRKTGSGDPAAGVLKHGEFSIGAEASTTGEIWVGSGDTGSDAALFVGKAGVYSAAHQIAVTQADSADMVAITLPAEDSLIGRDGTANISSLTLGDGLAITSGVLDTTAQSGGNAHTGDVTIFDDQVNADTALSIGTSAAECLRINVLNGASDKLAEEIQFQTFTASGTADKGKMTFHVDEELRLTLDDDEAIFAGGINVAGTSTVGAVTAANGAMTHTGSGVVSFATTDSGAAAIVLNASAGGIDIDSSSQPITIDTDNSVSIDSVVSSNFTMAANDASTQTLTISATNVGAGAGNLTLVGDTITATGDLTCSNLTVNGTTTTVNTTNLEVTDKLIRINNGGGATSANGAGIEVEENSSITGYLKVASDRDGWELKAPNTAGVLTIDPGTAAGSLIYGGAFALTVDASCTLDQNLAQAASPTFAGLTLTTQLAIGQGGTGLANMGKGSMFTTSAAETAQELAIGTTGQFLNVTSDGVPAWTSTLDGGTFT